MLILLYITGVCDTTNILRFVLDSICFLQGYLNNPINNMKIALPTDHVSHMAKGHICEKPNALIIILDI